MINKFVSSLLFVFITTLQISAQAANEPQVTIIEPDETFRATENAIAHQTITGNDPSMECSYYELLEKAKNTAITLGANVVKINKHVPRSQKQYCDELAVSFYKVADVLAYEQRFSWTEERKLSWDDFKGGVPSSAAASTAAETACGIAIETNTVSGSNPVKIYVFNTFMTSRSWVRPQHKTAPILKHEQGHFDICELYTRLMRERFSKATLEFRSMQRVIREVYNKTMQEYSQRQAAYEAETKHGVEDDAQERWTQLIARELSATEKWKSK